VLEDAGYVDVRKGAVGRRPRTWFRLTAHGRQALEGHLAWLAQLEEAVSAGTREPQPVEPLPDERDRPRRAPPPLLGSS
jgi:DNA-binding PadR family transcriptional regulator